MPPQTISPNPGDQPVINPAPAPPAPAPTPPPTPEPAVQPPPPAPPAPPGRSRAKTIIIAVAVVAVLAAAGVAAYFMTKSDQPAPASNQTPAGSSQLAATAYSGDNFEITPPSGWRQADNELIKVLVGFVDPASQQSASGTYSSSINVLSESSRGLSLDKYVDETIKASTRIFSGYEVVERNQITLGGRPAYLLTAKFSQGENATQMYQLVADKDGKVYIVTGASSASDWDKYSEILRTSLLTFKLK